MESPLCENTEHARLNRARVKEGYGNEFYQSQARSVAQWHLGEPPPEGVILGDLPYAGKLPRAKPMIDGDD